MFSIGVENKTDYTFLGLFAGAVGLDLGFELAGFQHTESNEILDYAVETLRMNRPNWEIVHGDVRDYNPSFRKGLDVLLAGFPCQGFSLGGNRNETDERNTLYREVVRIANHMQPRVIVMENVLNLRTMTHPETGKPFAQQISDELAAIGYTTIFDFFRVSQHGVPQTRRRFIFIAYKADTLKHFKFPKPQSKETSIKDFLYDLGQDLSISLPNHDPSWGFKSYAHTETDEPFDSSEKAIPVRFSRTASEGNPVRDFDSPFPAVDTATVWGWGKGNVIAERITKDREGAMYVRNPDSEAKLWRIKASKLRPFTAREYARLQTFPDDWIFYGNNKRELQLQIGNAVPVIFAEKIALKVREALEFLDGRTQEIVFEVGEQTKLF
ncbi:DNA (cytosine-5-)-methyltransferase [Runella sp.]|jgi:DNA (cytosine-5)-methyltransferase 1|uniref:DNA cytosine methyltransferase n=1 Tax=Runella sp. TaxID=1960881 RepID=UPI00260F9D17|nr:DNA (cytosine-5-)-methyltransferase [Runella sp.]